MRHLRRLLLFVILATATLVSKAQKSEIIREYINTYKDIAIAEMQRTGVPASIKLAQGIHETFAGLSVLVKKSNNHFGIKCKANWTGESVSHDDDARGECFRKYNSAEESYRDHSNFLKNSARYASLFQLDPTDYEGWANGLKKAGYATNPKYPAVIIRLVEEYHLQDYTLIALGKAPSGEVLAKTETTSTPGDTPTEAAINTTLVMSAQPEPARPSYPEGEFKINDTKVVFIKKGTSYLAIAKEYNISLSRLFEFNELREMEEAESDQLVFLQRKRRTGKPDFHTVRAGETVRDIAQEEGIRLEALMEYNWMRGDMQPAVGEQLALRGKASAMPKLALRDNYTITPRRGAVE